MDPPKTPPPLELDDTSLSFAPALSSTGLRDPATGTVVGPNHRKPEFDTSNSSSSSLYFNATTSTVSSQDESVVEDAREQELLDIDRIWEPEPDDK